MTAKLHWTLPKGQRTTFHENDYDLVITSNGYVEFRTPAGNRMEVILAFPQLANAIEEERNQWWREQ